MTYEEFIHLCIQAMQTGNLTQKTVRKSQEFLSSPDLSQENHKLSIDLQSSLLQLLETDVLKGHFSISLLVEGNSHIRRVLTDCSNECLNSILASLKIQSYPFNGKGYQMSVKALYGILQYCLPLELTSEIKENLEEILKELNEFILSDNLIPEVGLISSSSIILIISINRPNPARCFYQILNQSCFSCPKRRNALQERSLKNIDVLNNYSTKLTNSIPKNFARCVKYAETQWNLFSTFDTQLCYPNLALIHGVLNVKPLWLFETSTPNILKFKDRFQVDHCAHRSTQALNMSLFIKLWTFIKNHCTVSSSYSQQAIQVLFSWLQLFYIFIRGELKVKPKCDLQTKTSKLNQDTSKFSCTSPNNFTEPIQSISSELTRSENDDYCRTSDSSSPDISQHFEKKLESCLLCSDILMKPLFSLEENDFGEVVQVLNFIFENQNKGVASLMLQCYKELLHLHDHFLPGHSVSSIRRILKSILSSDTLTSKGSYLLLQVAIEILSPQEVLLSHPSIPHNLCLGLKTNQFAALATSVCRSLTAKLTSQECLLHFETVHRYCIETEDQVLWQNYKTLWLPLILSQHPPVIKFLLGFSYSGCHEWEAGITLLRLCRSKGIVTIMDCIRQNCKSPQSPENAYSDDLGKPTAPFLFRFTSTGLSCHNISFCDEEDSDGAIDVESILWNGLIHVDDNIRAEAFSVLCVTQKTSFPLSGVELILLRRFLTHNMNTDSQSFRQSILKSFHSLVCRIRDSCLHVVKKAQANFKNYDFAFIENNLSGEALASLSFLVWLIHKLNDDLSPLGNYSRHSTALNLYWILLDNFFNFSKTSQSATGEDRYVDIRRFIHFLSKSRNSDESKIINMNLTCSRTVAILLTCCAYEMNDVREKACQLLILLHNLKRTFENDSKVDLRAKPECTHEQYDAGGKRTQKSSTINEEWFSLSLNLMDSPKASEMESGTTLVRVLLDTSEDATCFLQLIREDCIGEREVWGSANAFEEILKSFVFKIETQFAAAQKNILMSSLSSPISGTVLALTRCFMECHPRLGATLRPTFLFGILFRLSVLYREMVRFVLASLAICSAGESNVPPSFAEMGRSIDAMIAQCQAESKEKLNLTSGQDFSSNSPIVEDLEKELEDNESETLSTNQQMVLSFCWHLLKMCCWSAAQLTQKFSELLEDSVLYSFLNDVVVSVLTGTRHKGAMESAQDALALITRCVFEKQRPASEDIVKIQLSAVLDVLEESSSSATSRSCPRRTSTTRRAAGLSMLFAAICGNVPPAEQMRLVSTVVSRLVTVARTKVEVEKDSGEVDLSPALSLHILQSMVLSSRLTYAMAPHLSTICILCLQRFTCDVWSMRNAALQLFGAVVPRLLGQKKVKDDTASLNSITAVEFYYRNPSLTTVILDLLSECSRKGQKGTTDKSSSCARHIETQEVSGEGDSVGVGTEVERNPTHPSLVPVLSLLARLNPGTGIQRDDKIKSILDALVDSLFSFLDSPIFTVRRLASSVLVTLSSNTDLNAENSLEAALDRLSQASARSNNNLTHGWLLFVANTVTIYPNVLDSRAPLKDRVTSCLRKLLHETPCFLNRTLIVNVLHQLNHAVGHEDAIVRNSQFRAFHPGYSLFKRMLVRSYLSREREVSWERFLLSDDQDIREETHLFVNHQLERFREKTFSGLQDSLWLYLKNESLEKTSKNRVKMGQVFDLLASLLDTRSVNLELAVSCIPLFEKLLSEDVHSSRYVVILVAYVVAGLCVEGQECDAFQKLAVRWARVVYKLTSPRVSEDYRLCASKALSICLEDALHSDLSIRYFVSPLVKASFNLLQDEDKAVRTKSSSIVRRLRSDSFFNVTSSVASAMLVNRIFELLAKHPDFDYIALLWDLCFEFSFELLKDGISDDPPSRNFTNLFESTTANAYREAQGLADIICARLETVADNCHRNATHKTEFPSQSRSHFQQFIIPKIRQLRAINDNLPTSMNPRECINWNIVHKLTVVKNGVKFLKILETICGVDCDLNLEILYPRQFTGTGL